MAEEALKSPGLGITPAPAAKTTPTPAPTQTKTPPPAVPAEAKPASTATEAPKAEAPTEPPAPKEIDVLKSRADMMNISYPADVLADVLKAKIEAKMNGDPDPEEKQEVQAEQPQANPLGETPVAEAPELPLRERLRRENMRLVRCKITNLDPKKKDLHGEIFTVANELLGTVRKFIPYGEATENGYHIPFWLYKRLKKRKFLNIRTTRDRRTGTEKTETAMVLEFAIEVLDPLDQEELGRLAMAQVAAGSVEA